MKIQISEDAAKWYKDELELESPSHVRFYVRYGGFGGNIPGFSLGINVEEPEEIHSSAKVDHITFFVDQDDAWYFEEKDLQIDYNPKMKEPEFHYE